MENKKMNIKRYSYGWVVFLLISIISGCADTQTKAGEGAGIGGVLGAITGGIIGYQTHDAAAGILIGGAVGAAGGAAVGSQIPQNPSPQQVPVVIAQPAVVAVPAVADSLSVNVPNNHGGYTLVILKRSGDGFVGPQGEYYPQFPEMSQLKVMYGT